MIYSPVDYSMGADVAVSVPSEAQVDPVKAKAKLREMRASLKKWLLWRQKSNAVADGAIKAKPGRAIGHLRQKWRAERLCGEQGLADHLHLLLTQAGFDIASLPDPDVAGDPEAAAKLAVIAVSGKLPEEQSSPSEQGFIWLWPALIAVGIVGYVITSKIRNDAEIEMEKERTRCIQEAGWLACDEYALVKIGALGLGAFWIYTKFLKRKAKRT